MYQRLGTITASLPALALAAACTLNPGSKAQAVDSSPLYSIDNKTYSSEELSPAARQALYEAAAMYHRNVRDIVEETIIRDHISAEAKRQGKDEHAIEDQLFGGHATEADAKAWFDANKARLGGRDFAGLKGEIMHFLSQQKKQAGRAKVAEKLLSERKFAFLPKEPVAPQMKIATAGYPRKGSAKPKVTIVEFADYQCPHCAEASVHLRKLVERYKDKVELVFLDFPLRPGGVAEGVAEGAVCAQKQERFWDYHYRAFEQQQKLSANSPRELAKELSLDMQKFEACLKDPTTKKRVVEARKMGEDIGVGATPSIYIDGRKQAGYAFEQLEKSIQAQIGS